MKKAKPSLLERLATNYYYPINNSKLLAGLGMIILNLFSKYVVLDLSKSQEAFIRNTITRELLIFVISFVGTRDLLLSLFLTATFVVLSGTIFNEKSKFCMIPDKYKYLYNEVDINKDGQVSDKEIKKAKEILYKANIRNNNKFY
tara:strand:+ start:432 stop:866 length:435 start_codon:yes stop_codon:yes gene_type:complete